MKNKKHKYLMPFALAAGLIAILILILITGLYHKQTPTQDSQIATAYRTASDDLKQAILSEISQDAYNILRNNQYTVFLSYSNGNYLPTVRHAVGKNISDAWDDIDNQIEQAIQDSEFQVKYLKCDIVSETNETSFEQLREEIANNYSGRCHYGIAFDKKFDIALLEQECNHYRIFDKSTNNVLLSKTNAYLAAQTGQELKSMPSSITTFKCESWLYEIESGEITKLSSQDANYGIRDFELNKNNLATIIATSGYYLRNNIDEYGKFVYAFWPQDRDSATNYSTVRHIDALLALEQYYELTSDSLTQDAIRRGIEFLFDYILEFDNASYVRCTDEDESPDEIRMGGAGLLLTVLSEYERLFGDNRYQDLLNSIANGIIKQTQPNGHTTHVLNLDLTTKRDYWTEYYDGEIIIGLCNAYDITGNQDYLDTAMRIAEYCLNNNYATTGDHWFVNAMNELTKILPNEVKYYHAGLLAVARQAETINQSTEDPTKLEQLMGAFEIYNRAIENHMAIPDEFDITLVLSQIQTQSESLLNNYMFPEKAMYSPCISDIIGAFYTEEYDGWKIRIDMIQHHLSGYYKLYCNYELIQKLCT